MTGSTAAPQLTGICYLLGEQRCHHTELPEFAATRSHYDMPDDARLWGWGDFRRSDRPLAALFVETARASLDAAGLTGGDIDSVILCATHFPGRAEEHAVLSSAVADALDLHHAWQFGLTLNRCATMLSAVLVAADLVRGGRYARVLVATADKVTDERERFEPFAIFSDGASSCIVTATATAGYELVASASTSCSVAELPANSVGGNLARAANQRLFASLPGGAAAVARVHSDNLFLPIVAMREQQAGFLKQQLFLDNVTETAHCFASDPLVNLVDAERRQPLDRGRHTVLASGTPGLRVALLLRRI